MHTPSLMRHGISNRRDSHMAGRYRLWKHPNFAHSSTKDRRVKSFYKARYPNVEVWIHTVRPNDLRTLLEVAALLPLGRAPLPSVQRVHQFV